MQSTTDDREASQGNPQNVILRRLMQMGPQPGSGGRMTSDYPHQSQRRPNPSTQMNFYHQTGLPGVEGNLHLAGQQQQQS